MEEKISIIAVVLSVIAILVSVISILRDNANSEISFYQLLDEREKYMMNLDPENNDKHSKELYYHACVSICNAYETVCAQYLRFRIPRMSFRNMYKKTIIKTVESDTFMSLYEYDKNKYYSKVELMDMPFPNTIKVYRKFTNKKM